jgi:hypothetical protein
VRVLLPVLSELTEVVLVPPAAVCVAPSRYPPRLVLTKNRSSQSGGFRNQSLMRDFLSLGLKIIGPEDNGCDDHVTVFARAGAVIEPLADRRPCPGFAR